MGSVVGEDGMDLVGDGGDQAAQEVCGGAARHLLMQFDEGEFRGPVDGDEEIELALRRFEPRRCRYGNSRSDRP